MGAFHHTFGVPSSSGGVTQLRMTEYKQRVAVTPATNVYQPVTFNNAAPLLVRSPKTFAVLRQSGEALVWFGRLVAPAPVYAGVALEQPKIERHRHDTLPFAWVTRWEYVLAIVDPDFVEDPDAWEAWPRTPVFDF